MVPCALAQAPSDPAILVLKLLSETHAKPTTGVILRPGGHVLIPAHFVDRGDQIIVLEGGLEIERHGRKTRTVSRSAELGIALLAAEELQQPGLYLSEDPVRPGETLQFFSFPPAEQLVEGRPAIMESVQISPAGDGTSFVTEPRLAHHDGLLINRCGHLAGLAIAQASDDQPDPLPLLLLGEALRDAVNTLGVTTEKRPCRSVARPPGPSVAVKETAADSPQILDPEGLIPSQPDLSVKSPALTDPVPDEPAQAAPPKTPSIAPTATASDPLEPGGEATESHALEDSTTDAASSANGLITPSRGLVALGFGLSAWLLFAWYRKKFREEIQRAQELEGNTQPIVPTDEMQQIWKDITVRAVLGSGDLVELSHRLGGEGATIGRTHADIVIGDTDVARAHIRLQCDAQGVLVTDIGSGKGTWVNGIACQDGETFRILSGTDIQLGRTRVSLSWNEMDGAPA